MPLTARPKHISVVGICIRVTATRISIPSARSPNKRSIRGYLSNATDMLYWRSVLADFYVWSVSMAMF